MGVTPSPREAPSRAPLAPHVVVWRAWLDGLHRWADGGVHLLADDEVARANRLVFDADRRRFVTSRLVLRSVLGRSIGQAPGTVEFDDWCHRCSRPHAKPVVRGAAPGFSFSLSRSAGLALIAVADRCAVGIDVERIDRRLDAHSMAPVVLAPRELDRFRAGATEPTTALLRGWTRKEAHLKMTGEGLATAMTDIEVSPCDARRWAIHTSSASGPAGVGVDLDAPTGYVAALALPPETHDLRVEVAHRMFGPTPSTPGAPTDTGPDAGLVVDATCGPPARHG